MSDDAQDTAGVPSVLPSPGPFVSYSANAEDVILHRLFRDRRSGTFVDVGAAHPRDENDTYALYLAGWRGVNIEPNPAFQAALRAERTEDINLDLALSDQEGDDVWYEVIGTGLSTLSAELAEEHRARGREVRPCRVRVSTLARVLAEAGIGSRFDLLKVDVEGLEERVLCGNDWDRFRPDVILVEATLPESPQRRGTNVGPFLEARGYRHAYFDGLNDFYVEGSFDPGTAFAAPPNVFDNAITRALADAHRSFTEAETYAKSLEGGLAEARGRASAWMSEAGALRALSIRLIGAGPVSTAELVTFGARPSIGESPSLEVDQNEESNGMSDCNLGTAPFDGTSNDLSGKDTALALVAARATALEAEIRRLGHELDDVKQQKKRLRNSAAQMRAEILTLNRSLEMLHVRTEELETVRTQFGAVQAQSSELAAALRTEREKAAELHRWLTAIASSASWKLAGPYRVVGRRLKRMFGR